MHIYPTVPLYDQATISVRADEADNNSTDVLARVLHYEPSKALAVVGIAVYALAAIALFYRLQRRRDWWGLCLPIGAACEAVGFALRLLAIHSPSSVFIYAIMQLFIVCSPAAFLAFNYILYGRFVSRCVGAHHSLMRPTLVAKFFVISDITTFLIQAGGGGMQASQSIGNVGAKLFLIGLILQATSYLVFCCLFLQTHLSIKREGKSDGDEPWWKIIWLLYFSSVFILIRCIYRVIELAQGNGGFLLTHEVYFYLLDTLPLIIAISCYIPFWPGRYITVHTDFPLGAVRTQLVGGHIEDPNEFDRKSSPKSHQSITPYARPVRR